MNIAVLNFSPNVGKTTIAKTLAKVIGCEFSRIQFTPDTLPGDITGVNIYKMNTGTFEYVKGSVVSQIVLADEINRELISKNNEKMGKKLFKISFYIEIS